MQPQDLNVATPDSTYDRIDIVVIYWNENPQNPVTDYQGNSVYTRLYDSFQLAIIQGTPASNPSAPATPAGGLKLAEIYVPAGATAITDADITDTRAGIARFAEIETARGGYVSLDARLDADELDLANHKTNTNNPHQVTALQIGINDAGGNFTAANVEDALAEEADARQAHEAAAAPHSGHETPAGAQAKVDAHASNASAHHTRYTDAEAVSAVKAADGSGSGLDADLLDGRHASQLVPAGTIIAYADSTPPDGWLECNGQAVSRTTYADLFAAIGTTFGAGDSLTTFNLPDLRGEFIRGWDNGRGVDVGRSLGSF